MKGARFGRWSFAMCVVALGLAGLAAPAYAQSGVKGKVVDANNKPVQGAVVVIEMSEGMTRKFEVKTNRNGDYIQIGLPPGQYKITASKDGMSQSFNQRVSLDMVEINFSLKPGSTGEMSDKERKEAEAKVNALKGAFEQGVTLSNEGKNDEAIAKFNEVIAGAPKCTECYMNIATIQTRKKEFDQAEATYKKVLEINPSSPDAYNGLATVYNAQRKFDQAAEASAQAQKLSAAAGGAAGGGASASSVYNQGVIFWNASKVADAKKAFEEAIKIDPKFADAHYWLGMANLNEGKMPDAAKAFDEYLKLAPTGQYAEQAKGILSQIKK